MAVRLQYRCLFNNDIAKLITFCEMWQSILETQYDIEI